MSNENNKKYTTAELPNFIQESIEESNQNQDKKSKTLRDNAKKNNKKKQYKMTSLKRKIIQLTIELMIIIAALRGVVAFGQDIAKVAIEWVDEKKSIEEGKKILREEGRYVLPEGYGIYEGPNGGYVGQNENIHSKVEYENLINIIQNEKNHYNISNEATAEYLKEKQGVSDGFVEDVCGKKVSKKDIEKAAIEAYEKSLENTESKGRGGH